MIQTILGSGGAIGIELARSLTTYTDQIRLVSRNPARVNPGDELVAADLLDPDAVNRAVQGSSIVYVTVGFAYNLKVWQESWPGFMRSVLDACIAHGSKLVFFDNIYMYDPDYLHDLTEETPVRPVSRKGEVRTKIAGMILDEVGKGRLQALIARAADFYGPGIQNTSVLNETVFKPLSEGNRAMWMGSVKCKHSYTYTPDAGRATAMLGNADDAFNQVWHMPTAPDPMTGEEIIKSIAARMNVAPKYRVLTKPVLRLLGIFLPVMKEMPEMIYQYNRDYIFNSKKFETRFGFTPTSYDDGINNVLVTDYSIG